MPITSKHPASSRWCNSRDTLPPDLSETHPIIAQHFFGLKPRDVRETWWSFARQGVEGNPATSWDEVVRDLVETEEVAAVQ